MTRLEWLELRRELARLAQPYWARLKAWWGVSWPDVAIIGTLMTTGVLLGGGQ